MAPLRLDKKEKTLSERPQEAQNLEQQQFIPDAAEEDLVHSLLEKVAERHIS